jgi:hypothetical protein
VTKLLDMMSLKWKISHGRNSVVILVIHTEIVFEQKFMFFLLLIRKLHDGLDYIVLLG